MIHCRYCENDHGDLLLCPPARRVLDALAERGQRFDMPVIEFAEPALPVDAFGGGTVLVQQVVVKAGVTEVAGVAQPVLILTGQSVGGGVLPEWIYPASEGDLRRARDLFSEMTEMAIRRAKLQRQGGSRGHHH